MNGATQIRRITGELVKRLPIGTSSHTVRELALDIHQALWDVEDTGQVQAGVDSLTGKEEA